MNVDTPLVARLASFTIARDTLEFEGDEAASKEEKEKGTLLLQTKMSKRDISGNGTTPEKRTNGRQMMEEKQADGTWR